MDASFFSFGSHNFQLRPFEKERNLLDRLLPRVLISFQLSRGEPLTSLDGLLPTCWKRLRYRTTWGRFQMGERFERLLNFLALYIYLLILLSSQTSTLVTMRQSAGCSHRSFRGCAKLWAFLVFAKVPSCVACEAKGEQKGASCVSRDTTGRFSSPA